MVSVKAYIVHVSVFVRKGLCRDDGIVYKFDKGWCTDIKSCANKFKFYKLNEIKISHK